ncbi:hypothetical protein BC941DRAFT_431296 [Chlamydoabsidia padenii]|nr:hypothetical protein BC941DRAFT_431296 [Chlamydoabsidia padenii]
MAFYLEYDDSYIAGQHKASSITSTDSDQPPSLYTGHADSCSSLYDPDEPLPVFEDPSPFEPMKWNGRNSICIPSEDPSSFCPVSSVTIPVTDKPKDITTNRRLSKDEKRVNHIASEQKRRQNIRTGFQQLTDLIPTLKSMPHSKSTILFKTADYIKHTEKRNKVLLQRLKQLQQRVAPTYQQHIRRLQQQVLQQQELLIQHNIPHRRPALIMPTTDPIPCLHIPADTEFDQQQESMLRDRLLLSGGKLNL